VARLHGKAGCFRQRQGRKKIGDLERCGRCQHARHPRRFDPVTNALSIEAINAETDATIRYLGLAGIEKAEAGMLSYGGQRLLDMGVALANRTARAAAGRAAGGACRGGARADRAIIKRISSDFAGAAGRARHRPGF